MSASLFSPCHHCPTVPNTLKEACEELDCILSVEAKEFIQCDEKSISSLHHSLGRYLRNEWQLWAESKLAQYMHKEHNIQHPDDISHAILVEYSKYLANK